jgi:hypothetical protein
LVTDLTFFRTAVLAGEVLDVDAAAGLLDQVEDRPLRDRAQRLHTARLANRLTASS